MLRRKWVAIIYSLISILLVVSACNSTATQPKTMAMIDSDGDGWFDSQELQARTDPYNVDSDGDGYWDPKDTNPLDPNIPHTVPQTTNPTPSPKPAPIQAPEPEPTPVPIPAPSTPPLAPEPEQTPAPTPTPSEELALTVQLPEQINEWSPSTELITRNYTWAYKGEWSWEGGIPLFLYEYYQGIPRPPTKNYSVYVTHPSDDQYIGLLVEKIEKAAQQEGFTEYQTVEFAAAFVQSLPYTIDSVTAPYDEYPRYPIETLVDNGGDCEDTSILLASIIDEMGYAVVLIMLPDHCAVGVKGGENAYGAYYEYEGSKYYYIETTGEGWGIGDLPDEYKNTAASIRPMIPTPILTHEGSIKGRGYIAEVEVIVYNLGTAPAYNVSVLAGFDAGEGMVWNSRKSEPLTIGVNQHATLKLKLQIPREKHTRLVIQIGIDNVLVDESYTDWFDT